MERAPSPAAFDFRFALELLLYLLSFRPLLFLSLGLIFHLSVAKAQQVVDASPSKTAGGDDAPSSFQAINASIDTVLMQYDQLTGKVLIKDSNLSANALPITISVPQPVPKS